MDSFPLFLLILVLWAMQHRKQNAALLLSLRGEQKDATRRRGNIRGEYPYTSDLPWGIEQLGHR